MELLKQLQNRRSVRVYTQEEIAQEKLEAIVQAALLGPSSRGIYPAEYIVVRNRASLDALSRCKKGAGLLKGAEAAIVVIGNRMLSDAWIEDCSIAMMLMHLQAQELGIGSCWVQCRERVYEEAENGEKISTDSYVRHLLNIPDGYAVEAILALGMPAQVLSAHPLPDVHTQKVHEEKF